MRSSPCQPVFLLRRQIGMEMWARYAHKSLWHDFEPGWRLHKSHHVPRLGPFEDNDVFAIMNAVPAMGLCAYGFLTPNVIGGVSILLSRSCLVCAVSLRVTGILCEVCDCGLARALHILAASSSARVASRVASHSCSICTARPVWRRFIKIA